MTHPHPIKCRLDILDGRFRFLFRGNVRHTGERKAQDCNINIKYDSYYMNDQTYLSS